MTLAELKAQRAEKLKSAQSIITAAKAMGRDLSDDEASKVEEIHAEAGKLKEQISRAEKTQAIADQISQEADELDVIAPPKSRAHISGVRDRVEDDPQYGFKKSSEFFAAVRAAAGGNLDNRLRPLAAAGSDEQSGQSNPYGGFLIPTFVAPGILEVQPEDDPTASRVMNMPMQGPSISLPYRVDKNHKDSVSGGFRVSRRVETNKTDKSRGEYGQLLLKANNLDGLSFATNELIQDSPESVAALIQRGLSQEIPSKELDEKLNGTGVGMFMGVINAPCTIAIAKESAQAAKTILGENAVKMRSRCWGYGRAIWMANHDMYPAISNLHRVMTNDDQRLFVAGNGVDVPDTLLGRPIFFTEYTKTLGDKGDLVLGNWGEYIVGTRQGVQFSNSAHVRFEESEEAFKVSKRNDGKPWWDSALTPKNSAQTLSPFVVLAERA